MTTEQEFKARVTFSGQNRPAGRGWNGVRIVGVVHVEEEWCVNEPTPENIADAEEKLRELLWRRWNQMR